MSIAELLRLRGAIAEAKLAIYSEFREYADSDPRMIKLNHEDRVNNLSLFAATCGTLGVCS